MAYPHEFKARNEADDVIAFTVSGACSAGTATEVVNVPHGAYRGALTFHVEGTGNAAAVSVKPYVDKAQTIVGAKLQLALPSDAASLTTTHSLAATGTTRGVYAIFYPTDSPLTAQGLTSVFGMQVTVATTASGGTGTWTVNIVAAEG